MQTLTHPTVRVNLIRHIDVPFHARLTREQLLAVKEALLAAHPALAALDACGQLQLICAGGRFRIAAVRGGTLPADITASDIAATMLRVLYRAQPAPVQAVAIATTEGEYELELMPWEDPMQVAADAEAVIEEQDSKPWLGMEPDELDTYAANDPNFDKWLREGAPVAGFSFRRDFRGVTAAEYREDHIGM